MLEISKLQFAYGDLQVLWGVDLSVQQGEIRLELGLALGDADVAQARRVAQAVQAQLAPVRAELEGLKRFYGR